MSVDDTLLLIEPEAASRYATAQEQVRVAGQTEPGRAGGTEAGGETATLMREDEVQEKYDRTTHTDQKSYLRSLRYGAAQIVRIFSGSRQTALQATAAASRRAS